MTATVNVKFDRISRNHNVPDLQCTIRTVNDLAEQIHRYALRRCVSRDIEVIVDWDPSTGAGEGGIYAGFQKAGNFNVEPVS